MELRPILVVAALMASAPRSAHAGALGAACRAAAECDEGTWCVNNVCSDAAALHAKQESWSKANRINPWIRGSHGFLGVTLGGGPTAPGAAAGQLAIRAGVVWNGLQLLLEMSPGTTIFGSTRTFGGFDVTASVGALIPLSRSVAWILRLGGGGGFLYGDGCCSYGYPPSNRTPGFGEVRLDLFGLAVRASEHVVVEVLIPSFRLAAGKYLATSEFLAEWFPTATVEYVF